MAAADSPHVLIFHSCANFFLSRILLKFFGLFCAILTFFCKFCRILGIFLHIYCVLIFSLEVLRVLFCKLFPSLAWRSQRFCLLPGQFIPPAGPGMGAQVHGRK